MSDLDFNVKDENGHALLYAMQDELLATMGRFVDERLSGEPDWLKAAVHFRLRESVEPQLVRAASERAAGRSWSKPIDYAPAKKILNAARVAAAALVGRLQPASGGPPRGGAWVEYYDRGIFDHAFWRTGLRAPRPPLVYYLDRPDMPPTPERQAAIRADGFEPFDLRGSRTFAWGKIGLGTILREALTSLRVRPLWLAAVVFECRLWRAAYESLYLRFDVRLLVQHQDRGWKQAAQADALEKAGGIMVGYHWSNLPFELKDWYLTRQHVYFVWGKTSLDSILKKGHGCRHILPSGLWLDEGGPPPESIARLRARCRFVLCLFDSGVAWGLWQSPATLARFYDAAFGLLERHEDWGAVAKCKFSDFFAYRDELPGGEALFGRAQALIDAGRLVILPPAASPIGPAKAADLSFCYTLNSAGIAATLRGARAVHWDSIGLKDYFLSEEPGQQVVYAELADAATAVEKAAAGDRSIGDFSRWTKAFDYFADSKAAERVGRFMSDYLAARERLGEPLAAADAAAADYRRAYCHDWRDAE